MQKENWSLGSFILGLLLGVIFSLVFFYFFPVKIIGNLINLNAKIDEQMDVSCTIQQCHPTPADASCGEFRDMDCTFSLTPGNLCSHKIKCQKRFFSCTTNGVDEFKKCYNCLSTCKPDLNSDECIKKCQQ